METNNNNNNNNNNNGKASSIAKLILLEVAWHVGNSLENPLSPRSDSTNN